MGRVPFLAFLVASSTAALAHSAALPVAEAAADQSPYARAETIGFRLASRAVGRCGVLAPLTGISLQTLLQFEPADRPDAVSVYHLDKGPRILAVASDSPAAAAGLESGDVILTVDGRAMPASDGLSETFDQAAGLAAVDRVERAVADAAQKRNAQITVLRDSLAHTVQLRAVPGCPSHIHVARSNQLNSFADGVHVLLPIALITRLPEDDQLALVIAHEMAHNILGHAAQVRALTRGGDRLSLIRRQEDAADALGANLALDAGYDVVAGSKVFLRSRGGFDLSPSHRDAQGRIARTLAQARLRQSRPSAP